MKEDEALRNNRKTSMVVKSNQVNKAPSDPVLQAVLRFLSTHTSQSHGRTEEPYCYVGGSKDPKISPCFSLQSPCASSPPTEVRTPATSRTSYNEVLSLPFTKGRCQTTRRVGDRVAAEEIKEQTVALMVFFQVKKTLQTRSLQLSLTFGALQPNTQENWDCQRD